MTEGGGTGQRLVDPCDEVGPNHWRCGNVAKSFEEGVFVCVMILLFLRKDPL